jgi:hypothetical protein
MNLRHALSLFNENQPSSPASPLTDEESRQMDLLLRELNEHEEQLSPNYWATKAEAFANHMALQEAAIPSRRASRLSQLKPYMTSLLPLGGLVAVGLALSNTSLEQQTFDHKLVVNSANSATFNTAPPDHTSSEATVAPQADRAKQDEQAEEQLMPTKDQAPPAARATTTAAARQPLTPRVKARPSVTRSTRNPSALDTGAPSSVGTSVALVETPKAVEPEALTTVTSPQLTSVPADTFNQQLEALKFADKALKRGDNSGARDALARSFSPQLTLHANALRAVLACQSHDMAAGKRYLSAQAKSYPNSPYLERMRRACGLTSARDSQ